MVESESEMESATKRILEFSRSLGLAEGLVRGKLSEYLYQLKRSDFNLLFDAGILGK